MKNKLLISFLVFILVVNAIAQKKEVLPYVSFLKEQNTSPVDYIFNLFEKYDIVVLGERDHRDTTQYELIDKIISDPRFIKNVGHVFTEVGVSNQKDNLDNVLKSNYTSNADFEDALRKVYVNMDYAAIWEKYNYWMLLRNIYSVNKHLQPNEKISIYPTDIAFDWGKCKSHEEWITVINNIDKYPFVWDRDSVMGSHFNIYYKDILKDDSEKRKKALVVFNRPHSYKNYLNHSGYWLNSAVSYIETEYPNKVANVMINWISFQNKDEDWLIAKGKWDAAFKYDQNRSLGFDLADTPFGEDKFDHYDKSLYDTKYKDIYTGFIFYKPIEEWKCIYGIPGLMTDEFRSEFTRRLKVINPDVSEGMVDYFFSIYNELNEGSIYRKDTPKDRVEEFINYWLK